MRNRILPFPLSAWEKITTDYQAAFILQNLYLDSRTREVLRLRCTATITLIVRYNEADSEVKANELKPMKIDLYLWRARVRKAQNDLDYLTDYQAVLIYMPDCQEASRAILQFGEGRSACCVMS